MSEIHMLRFTEFMCEYGRLVVSVGKYKDFSPVITEVILDTQQHMLFYNSGRVEWRLHNQFYRSDGPAVLRPGMRSDELVEFWQTELPSLGLDDVTND
jgi:hypothetical protein